MSELSQQVRKRRRALGLTQKDLAGELGLSQAAVAQIESGRRLPSLDIVPRLARALRVSTDALFFGDDPQMLDLRALNAADRILLGRFRDFLAWEGSKKSAAKS